MKKGFRFYLICWLILVLLFNAFCFITPNKVSLTEEVTLNKFGGAFWVGYIGIMIAFVGQLLFTGRAFKVDSIAELFLNIPVIRISYVGLILTLIFGSVSMYVYEFPKWLGALICLIIAAFCIIAVVKAQAAAELVSRRGKEVAERVVFIKALTARANALQMQAKSEKAKDACRKVLDAIRYSDPMSSPMIAAEEAAIHPVFDAFAKAVAEDDTDTFDRVSTELLQMIELRNEKCKVLK